MTRYIFVTGGVVSGLGKGITAASLGRLLKARGLKVAAQKLDPYINVDPGTMSPYQHGEVYVTEDGAETDLDLGHYERFIDEDLNKYSNLTNLGTRPTVDGHHITVEPWILDYAGDLYGQTVTLEFRTFLRPERKFESLTELKTTVLSNAQQLREQGKDFSGFLGARP